MTRKMATWAWGRVRNLFRLKWEYRGIGGWDVCDKCSGLGFTELDGTVLRRYRLHDRTAVRFDANVITCGQCHGSGYVPLPGLDVEPPPWRSPNRDYWVRRPR